MTFVSMKTKEFPYKPVGRVARREAGMRMTDSAVKALRNAVLERAEEMASDIVSIARHANRKTVMKGDVLFVTRSGLPI
jgi:histone H3/H4